MKKFLLFILFFSGLAFLIASHFTSFRGFKNFPLEKLISERDEYRKVIGEAKGKLASEQGSSKEAAQILTEKVNSLALLEKEIFFKRYHADALAWFIMVISAIVLLSTKLRGLFRVKSKTVDSVIEEMGIAEDSPREVYVNEWEFNQKIEGGFKTKREAIEWLKMDPSLKCDYCGSRLRSTLIGKKEAVQLVTFYKKVPEGAKDLRVVLGSFWFSNPATELKCPSCERIIRR